MSIFAFGLKPWKALFSPLLNSLNHLSLCSFFFSSKLLIDRSGPGSLSRCPLESCLTLSRTTSGVSGVDLPCLSYPSIG